ncbi:unnamed protein product [Taenia asiatica]|uniref:Abasic site processing protein HMCES n=1 Tax=Taenia asiatica TaxID=60517 RepID=A0A3P6Q548_TAEAS|nr:unnamed protein product [Taenia asiatica]
MRSPWAILLPHSIRRPEVSSASYISRIYYNYFCYVNLFLYSSPVIIASTHVNSAFEANAQLEIIQVMLWGLIPSFVSNALEQASSGNKFATANARAENILERPSYMDCIKHRRRCVVVAQGYSVQNFPKDKKIDQFFTTKRKISENALSTHGEESVSKKRLEDL